MYQNIIIGIVSGIVTAIIIWGVSAAWNYKACRTVKIQSKRMQCYLSSISNDITWGVEDCRDDYYDNLLLIIPFVLQSIDIARDSLSLVNFRVFRRRLYIEKQLTEITNGMETMLNEAVGAAPEQEKKARLQSIKNKYQTSCNNILYYRAVFLEKLTKLTTVQAALENIEYDESADEIKSIYEELKKL